MPRQKLTHRILEKAELRAAGLAAIDPKMDFGDARNLQNMLLIIEQYRSKITIYNTALTVIDSSKTEMEQLNKILGDLSERMLIGVAFRYGKDSSEYEMAGAVRKSDRIRKSTATRLKAVAEETSNENPITV